MLAQTITVVALVTLSCVLVMSNPYGPTYNDGYEQPQSYQAAPSYHQPQQSYGHQQSYQPAPAPAYHAPAYPKYQAPSSAHHTQYDNYYPKQTYSKPMYAPKPYSPPAMYQQPAYSAPKPAYPAPSYGSHHDMEEYKRA